MRLTEAQIWLCLWFGCQTPHPTLLPHSHQVTLSYDLEPGSGAVVQKGLHKVSGSAAWRGGRAGGGLLALHCM